MAVTEIGHVIEHFHQNVPIQQRKYQWDILASLKVLNHVTYLCHSRFGIFWQPWRNGMKFQHLDMVWQWEVQWVYRSF